MIVDASAVIAVLRREPEADDFLGLLLAGPASMSAVSRAEPPLFEGDFSRTDIRLPYVPR